MQEKKETPASLDNLLYLPAFAHYLLTHKLTELATTQLRIGEEINLSMMQFFKDKNQEQRLHIVKQALTRFLTYLSQNKASQHIEHTLRQWKENQLPLLGKDDIDANDITQLTYLRKKSFLYFVPDYCSGTEQMIELIKEMDWFLHESETAFINFHIDLLKDRIKEHSHFIEKITNTTPGVIYVYDILHDKEVYTNRAPADLLGYTPNGVPALGKQLAENLIHPDDWPALTQYREEFKTTKDGEIRSFKYRIRTDSGEYRWLRTYETVFKRTAQGEVSEKIGIAVDVHKQKLIADQLRKREAELLEAQEIAQMGSFTWDLEKETLQGSPQIKKILEAGFNGKPTLTGNIHPDDRKKLEEAVTTALQTGRFECEYRYLGHTGEKILWARGLVHYRGGKAVAIHGTMMDITQKQKLIGELREKEFLYQQAQALANIGSWTWNVQNDKVEWSDELYRIYEVPLGEVMTYEKIAAFVHPDEKEAVHRYLYEAIKNKTTYDRVHRIVLRNGKIKTIHRRAEVIDEKGQSVKLVGTTQDVTEFYRVQQELKENQTFIRKIADATPSIIASYNVNTGQYVFISEGIRKLLGYPVAEVMTRGIGFFWDIVHPDDRPVLLKKNQEALDAANAHPGTSDLIVEFTYRLRHRNGSYRWFHTYGTIFDRNAENKVEHILNISLDITEQQEATQKIADQEHFIQQIAEASPTILYLYDVEKQSIVYINREVYFVLDYLPQEILEAGQGITQQLYHPDDYHLLPARKESSKNFQRTDAMMQYECRMKNKEGEWRWFLVREIVFETNQQGGVQQVLGAALDISRRKEMEKTILQNTLLLEQSNASLEEFAYVASHDLKEPLRKISTFGDRLVSTQSDRLSPEGIVYLKKIVDASQRMQTMISDLLSISMISGNRSFERYSLQKILDDTLQTLEFKIEQQNATVRSDRLPEANIIPAQFRQLFQNLLSNSLKFVHPERPPVIEIRHSLIEGSDLAPYQLADAAQYHKIEISDNGIGFESEFAGKIFAIFQRLHGKSEYEGSGIGLAICKKIVEHHGGIIYASSAPDEGATFTIILPA